MQGASELKAILSVLAEFKVSFFKNADLEVSFTSWPHQPSNREPPGPLPSEILNVDEPTLPPDLRSDAITDYDKVLFYSGSPEPEELPLPGTGEERLSIP